MKYLFYTFGFVVVLCACAAGLHYTGTYDISAATGLSQTENPATAKVGHTHIGAKYSDIKTSLGEPRFVTAHIENNRIIEIWGYHFENDGRPTVLELTNGKLTDAYRSSYADINARYGKLPFQLATR